MRTLQRHRGSILIWSLLLGLSLATVFFFFAQRLQQNRAAQRETMEYQNARLLMESYVGYLKTRTPAELSAEYPNGTVNFEGISGTLTKQTDEITGFLDDGESVAYEVTGGNAAKVEWNHCDGINEDEDGLLDLDAIDGSPAVQGCASFDYKDLAQTTTDTNFTITASGMPVHYRITPIGDAILLDKEWTLSLEMTLGPRKKISVTENFEP